MALMTLDPTKGAMVRYGWGIRGKLNKDSGAKLNIVPEAR